MSRKKREELIAAARVMNESGLNRGTSGNLSVRVDDGMLITPSGMNYTNLASGDIVHVPQSGQFESSRAKTTRRPSSEWRIHRDIYRRHPQAGAVIHAHSDYCVTLACLGRSIPAFHYMVAAAGGHDIRCAGYATFGTAELSDRVLEALEGRKACLMAHHGQVCFSSDLSRTLALAIEVEHLAKAYCQCLAVEEPAVLSEEEMARVVEKFRFYGPSEDSADEWSLEGAVRANGEKQ